MNVRDLRIFVNSQEKPGGVRRANGICSIGILLILLIAFSFSSIGGAADLANAATEKADETAKMSERGEEENRKKIRQANDLKLKLREPLFPKQAKSLAKGYRETAERVARQGGDPKPLLDAAAHFERIETRAERQ